MELTAHINLGNHESLTLKSGEHDTIVECRAELDDALAVFDEPRIDDYRKRITMED